MEQAVEMDDSDESRAVGEEAIKEEESEEEDVIVVERVNLAV